MHIYSALIIVNVTDINTAQLIQLLILEFVNLEISETMKKNSKYSRLFLYIKSLSMKLYISHSQRYWQC